MRTLTRKDLPALLGRVDHTLLKPEATAADVRRTAREGRDLGTAAVCVSSAWVHLVAEELAGSGVRTCSVVGFPLGASLAAVVAAEAAAAVDAGAEEVDMVLPVGLLRSGDAGRDRVRAHLDAVRAATPGRVLKVILETALLQEEEVGTACALAEAAGADFVKTSTGFNPAGGATTHAVARMRACVGERLGVKASGGVRTLADAEAMLAAGASRLGMSSTLALLAEYDDREARR